MPAFALDHRRAHASLIQLPVIALFCLACTSEADPPDTSDGGTAGAGAGGGGGTAGESTNGGASATGGGAGTNTNGGASAGGTSASGGANGGGAGASTGGARAGGASTGGVSAGGSAGDTAAGNGAGGSSTGGAPVGGVGGLDGMSGASGFGGAGAASGAAGAAGSLGSSDVAGALDGLRVDDPCVGTPTTEDGAVCNHVVLTQSGGFHAEKAVTIAGTTGTTYDVTLRIRGIVEPTSIGGGMRPDTSTFQYMNMTWRTVPLTIGGTVQAADYGQWHINVANPEQDLYLNDYQKTGHYIFKLDYEVTVAMAANTTVTLDGTDSNERQIVNYEEYALDGIPGSMNHGQFIQINVVGVVPRDE